jgi:hypothetical protein
MQRESYLSNDVEVSLDCSYSIKLNKAELLVFRYVTIPYQKSITIFDILST